MDANTFEWEEISTEQEEHILQRHTVNKFPPLHDLKKNYFSFSCIVIPPTLND